METHVLNQKQVALLEQLYLKDKLLFRIKNGEALFSKIKAELHEDDQEEPLFEFKERLESPSGKKEYVCLCGRRIKTCFVIHHVKKDITITLGSGCIKKISEASFKSELYVKFHEMVLAINHQLKRGVLVDQMKYLEDELLKPKERKRLAFGIPLTEFEVRDYQYRFTKRKAKLNETYQCDLESVLRAYVPNQEAPLYHRIMAVMCNGVVINTPEDLLKINLNQIRDRIEETLDGFMREDKLREKKTLALMNASHNQGFKNEWSGQVSFDDLASGLDEKGGKNDQSGHSNNTNSPLEMPEKLHFESLKEAVGYLTKKLDDFTPNNRKHFLTILEKYAFDEVYSLSQMDLDDRVLFKNVCVAFRISDVNF